MRSIPSLLQSDLEQEVITLANCWKITRVDSKGNPTGTVNRYTSCDIDLVVDGDTYKAHKGGSTSALEFKITMSVNNLEVAGFLDDSEISERDLVAGLFKGAHVEFFIVNWKCCVGDTFRMTKLAP